MSKLMSDKTNYTLIRIKSDGALYDSRVFGDEDEARSIKKEWDGKDERWSSLLINFRTRAYV